jgi:hypothetical protein
MLLLAYGMYLLFSLKTHPGTFASVDAGVDAAHAHLWSVPRAIGSLVVASLLAAWMSEILVGAAEGTGKALGMSQTFIGIVFLAIVGGAAESGSAVAMAQKNKVDLSVGVSRWEVQFKLRCSSRLYWFSQVTSSRLSRWTWHSIGQKSGRCFSGCSWARSSAETANPTGTRESNSSPSTP